MAFPELPARLPAALREFARHPGPRIRRAGGGLRRRAHLLHHFKNEHYWYGVTMLGGDHLFGTAADPERVPASPTARRRGGRGLNLGLLAREIGTAGCAAIMRPARTFRAHSGGWRFGRR